MIAMPAVMLQKNTSHIRTNLPERMACRAVRPTAGALAAAAAGVHGLGANPSGGFTMNRAGTSVSTMKMPARV